MMAAPQPPVARKVTLMKTARRLAAALALIRSTMHANSPDREGREYKAQPHGLSPTDPSRIPAYLRRHRVSVRLQSSFDADALNPWQEGAR
jgi:hypothetical protein